VVFFMLRAAPGNPYSAERMLTPAVEANLKASLGLDKPLHEQYFEYVGKVVQGDLGPSMVFYDKDVSELLGEGLPVSLTIGLLSITIALFFGVLLGVLAAACAGLVGFWHMPLPWAAHGALTKLLMGVIALHAVGAVKRQIDGDGTLTRMWRGQR
jgi:oligopeptide transport system permease protein